MKTEVVHSGEAKLRVAYEGSGPAVVFLHAGVADRRMWRGAMEALAADHLVLAYDRRGFGESSTPDEEFSHSADLESVLEAFGLACPTLVGCSQGGRIALDYALGHGERVEGLMLLAPAISGDDPGGFPHSDQVLMLNKQIEAREEAGDLEGVNALEALAWLDGPLGPEGRVGGEVRELFLDMNRIALVHDELTRELEPPPAMNQLGRLKCRIQILWGDRDFPYIIDRCQLLQNILPNARNVRVEGAAHLIPMEMPAVFNEHLRSFLRGEWDKVVPGQSDP